jgi:hypothetical protein
MLLSKIQKVSVLFYKKVIPTSLRSIKVFLLPPMCISIVHGKPAIASPENEFAGLRITQ